MYLFIYLFTNNDVNRCMYSFGYFPGVWLLYAGYEVWSILHTSYPAYEDGTDRVFRNVGIQQSDAGEIPKRIHTRFQTRRKFEIKNDINPLNAELNPICHLLALLGTHHILHVSRIRVNITAWPTPLRSIKMATYPLRTKRVCFT